MRVECANVCTCVRVCERARVYAREPSAAPSSPVRIEDLTGRNEGFSLEFSLEFEDRRPDREE